MKATEVICKGSPCDLREVVDIRYSCQTQLKSQPGHILPEAWATVPSERNRRSRSKYPSVQSHSVIKAEDLSSSGSDILHKKNSFPF